MPRSRPAYPLKFRRKLIELVESGRRPEELAKEFEPSAQTIRNWVKRAQADGGKRSGKFLRARAARASGSDIGRGGEAARFVPNGVGLPLRGPHANGLMASNDKPREGG